MKVKRHIWSPTLYQYCRRPGCKWWRKPKDGRHGMSTSTMLYARSVTRHAPNDALFMGGAAPPCEGTR
jgi:hypothetical protein